MNIFVLHEDPKIAAQFNIDKHVIKMLTELMQLLSTAHRVLDGKYTVTKHPVTGKVRKFYVLPGEEIKMLKHPVKGMQYDIENPLCFRHSHMTHPCELWIQHSSENYIWALEHSIELAAEFNRRYGHSHGSERVIPFVSQLPKNIPIGALTKFPTAMPEQYKVDDPVQSYKNYYLGEKVPFATWTNTPVPDWFLEGVSKEYDASHFTRTR